MPRPKVCSPLPYTIKLILDYNAVAQASQHLADIDSGEVTTTSCPLQRSSRLYVMQGGSIEKIPKTSKPSKTSSLGALNEGLEAPGNGISLCKEDLKSMRGRTQVKA